MRILITGGSGFIGTNLVERYLSRGEEVLNFDIAPPRNAQHRPCWRQVDILDLQPLRTEIASFSPTCIVNMAATTGTADRGRKLEDYATNYEGVRNLISAARESPGLERVIFVSTMLVCRMGYQPKDDTDYCPDTLYGRSKMLGEKVVREASQLPYCWTIVRPIGIWGPWFDMPYKNLFEAIQKRLYVHPGGSNVNQSLGFVGNTVCQLDRLLKAPGDKIHGKTFYLADYPPTNMRAWVNLVQEAFQTPRIHQVPVPVLKALARVGDIMKFMGWNVPPLSTSRLTNMLASFVFNLEPLVADDLPYTLEQAVEITVNWMHKKAKSSDG
jgi:nucleoside-diphosphate-sugar epimerase